MKYYWRLLCILRTKHKTSDSAWLQVAGLIGSAGAPSSNSKEEETTVVWPRPLPWHLIKDHTAGHSCLKISKNPPKLSYMFLTGYQWYTVPQIFHTGYCLFYSGRCKTKQNKTKNHLLVVWPCTLFFLQNVHNVLAVSFSEILCTISINHTEEALNH